MGRAHPYGCFDQLKFRNTELFQAHNLWGEEMHEYRLYAFDGAGVLHMPHEFEARDDATAIRFAEAHWLDGRQMELWQDHRKVRC